MTAWLERILDFSTVLNASISASWLVLVVIGLRLVLKKAPKWVNVALWGVVALRLLMPFSIESVLSLIPSARTVSEQVMQAGPVPGGEPAYLEIVTNPSFGGTVSVELDTTVSAFQWDMVQWNLIWFGGMAVMALYTLLSYWRVRRKVTTAIRIRDDLYLSEYVESPFVLGLLRPRIYLPYLTAGMDHVIAHEQAHIRRKDHWWKPLGFLLLTVHWFNPLMWVAYILLCRDIELACDEKVIARLGRDQRADYTQALLNCSVSRRSIAACPLAFGEVGVKERVRAVMNYRKPAFRIILTAVVLCVIVAVCFLTDPAASPEFSMAGSNVSQLDADAILSRILKVEKLEDTSIRMNSDNFEITLDGDFNWADAQAIRYFYQNDHKTYSGQLRIFPGESKYFLTETEQWPDQDRHFLLRHYLEALKYLPQAEIKEMAPADRYQIVHVDLEEPGTTHEKTITYTAYGVGEMDGWFIHLRLQPLHESGGAYSGTGDEVIHLYYGHSGDSELQKAVSDGCVVLANGSAVHGNEIWEEFLENTQRGRADAVTIASVFDDYFLYQELSFDGDLYTITWSEGGTAYEKSYKYLMAYPSETLMQYVLVNDRTVTWEQIWEGLVSSQLGAYIDHHTVYTAPYPTQWGISLQVDNVRPNGATVILRQEGGYLPNRLFYGQDYSIQRKENGQWVDVEPVRELIWATIAYAVRLNDSEILNINWGSTFGTLEPGIYRFCKPIMDHRAPGDNENAVFYAEFVIEGEKTGTMKEPPALTVMDESGNAVEALLGTYQWTYDNGDGTMAAVCADSFHPLEWEDILIPLETEDDSITLSFALPPDSFTVSCWSDEYWGQNHAVKDSVTRGYTVEVKEGGYVYEVTAQWPAGTASYGFYVK